ncbi:MAG: carbohydrate porin [Bacteroidales bacterium]|jgi:porin|nr:carbohydrate porin [Bacteroidales bacterium]
MKTTSFYIFIVFMGVINPLFSQNEEPQNPFEFETSYTGDFFYNSKGGIQSGGGFLGMVNVKGSFNTENAGWWKGGVLFLNAANTHGREPSATFIGDYQVASNIEAGDLTYMHELWFKQSIGKFAFVLGLQDLCAEFISSDHASLFLNSSCGVHSTVATNMSIPIFPLTAIGAQIHFNITKNITIKGAAFDGVPDDFSFNKHNLNWDLKKEEGYLLFSQISYENKYDRNPGAYKLGFYYHNEYSLMNEDVDGLVYSQDYPENYGVYLIVDQTLLRNESGRELSVFFQSSLSPKKINENWCFIGGGFNFKGMFTGRKEDVFGFAIAHAVLQNNLGNETALEFTYKAPFGEHFYVQPDVQYIINPAGTDQKLENSLVGFLRFGIQF